MAYMMCYEKKKKERRKKKADSNHKPSLQTCIHS